jgi:hypothetical protein
VKFKTFVLFGPSNENGVQIIPTVKIPRFMDSCPITEDAPVPICENKPNYLFHHPFQQLKIINQFL